MRLTHGVLVPGALVALHPVAVMGDGTGLIGYGKDMYNPTCAFACRNVIKNCRLRCTPDSERGATNHGTAHNPVTTPPDCFVQDSAFLRTMAVCIDTYCPISNKPALSLIEDYWASHLGTGTLGDYRWVPAVSYHDAVAAGRADERQLPTSNSTGVDHSQHGDGHSGHESSRRLRARQHADDGFMTETGPNVTSPLPIIEAGAALNVTSFIAPKDWQKQYNGMLDFEANEVGHSTYSIVIMLVAILLPVPLSLLRFLPGVTNNGTWTVFQSAMIHPAVWGRRHREPTTAGGLVPTRGQALYIALISLLNIVLLTAPYVYHHPQSTFVSPAAQELSIMGNRAGVMAMANAVALFLFAARNNVLLYLTDWSYGTYLLLHRWLGYWAVFHTVLHSIMLLAYYNLYGSYQAELAQEYWRWGIVGTVAAVALVLTSLLVLRQRVYELFLASHVVLTVLFIVGYYYHIWYLYEYDWGYEIWAFIAVAIWALERLARLARMAWRGGYRAATVTFVPDTDGEYLRIDVEGVHLNNGGVAYLSFPTLGWRVWETHPFSVALSRSPTHHLKPPAPTPPADATSKNAAVTEKSVDLNAPTSTNGSSPTTTFFARVRTGMTAQLAARVASSGPGPTRLCVMMEGPYPHSGATTTQLEQCSTILYLAGGVGITALLPHLRSSARPARLFWSTRRAGLAAALAPALAELPGSVEVETVVGRRLDLDGILERELGRKPEGSDAGGVGGGGGDGGTLGIVVCGPAGMADHVRYKVVQLARNGAGTARRRYVLVDEAFSW